MSFSQSLRESYLLLIIALILATGIYFIHPKPPLFFAKNTPLADGEITLQTARSKWNDEIIWVDARSTKDYKKAHHPKAISLRPHNLETGLYDHFETLSSGKPVVIYCGSYACKASKTVAEHLKNIAGLENVWTLRGGWKTLMKK